ncbi:hypothetical protein FB451DRAFT_1393107 [Mycena latifolia]|nr:hypothetical protein FB451DRAFT_1393107 [Mycena latifolia]
MALSLHFQCVSMTGRRTLRSGEEFSEYDMAISRAISPPVRFDLDERVQECLLDEAANLLDENEAVGHELAPAPQATPPVPPAAPPVPPAAPPVPSSDPPPPTAKSRARRDRKRDLEQALSDNPLLKGVHLKRRAEGRAAAFELPVDTGSLPHSKLAWIGTRPGLPPDDEDEAGPPPAPPEVDTGLGGVFLTQDEVDALVGTPGFRYIPVAWQAYHPPSRSSTRATVVTDGAAKLLEECLTCIHLSEERLHHRRAPVDEQKEPGELRNNVANTELTDELLAHEHFRRLAGFANMLFALWAPLLFAFYRAVFAACTFNFGRAITAHHLDFANLVWGWCSITALGDFDPDRGGHLILWELRLVIRFPPGSTILIPSALIHHSNTPVHRHEHHSSFTQYTAGGLFRWIRNGFKTDEDFQVSASKEELQTRQADNLTRWDEGVQMFSAIDDL